jgi:hypothetical protein
LLIDHVPPVTVGVRVVVPLTHTELVPVIDPATGVEATVIGFVADADPQPLVTV